MAGGAGAVQPRSVLPREPGRGVDVYDRPLQRRESGVPGRHSSSRATPCRRRRFLRGQGGLHPGHHAGKAISNTYRHLYALPALASAKR